MTIESPMLAFCLLPLAAAALWFTRGLWSAAGRWLVRLTVLLLLGAVAGPIIERERPLKIAVMVDVSPSTRGAAFRDELALKTRLTPLLAGRPYSVHYFADGEQPTAIEPPATQTRLTTPPDADAALLLSDGRLSLNGSSSPIYPIIDPSLDAPGDAVVRSIRQLPSRDRTAQRPDDSRFAIDVLGQADRVLDIEAGQPASKTLTAGPATVESVVSGQLVASITPGDRWPENDQLSARAVLRSDERVAYGSTIPGFRTEPAQRLPKTTFALLNTSAVALSPGERLSAAQEQAIDQYVRTLGGTLVLIGRPSDAGDVLEKLSPLSARPTEGKQAWVVLIDASGSMAGLVVGVSKWDAALKSAASAIERLPKQSRVTVLRFAVIVDRVVNDATPAEALATIRSAALGGPSGRTGLRPALQAAADAAGRAGGARVLLLTDGEADLGEIESLTVQLKNAKATLSAITTNPSPGLAELCRASGGQLMTVDDPNQWDRAFSGLASSPSLAIMGQEWLEGSGQFTGRTWESLERWPVSVRREGQVLITAGAEPAAAVWPVGSGRVVAVSAKLRPGDLARLIEPFAGAATDPRFTVSLSDTADALSLTAIENGRPMNGAKARCERGGEIVPLVQAAPGIYQATLERASAASLAVVKVGDAIVTRLAIPGRYAKEFDVIGNDRQALAALAQRTGGTVIEAGDSRAIAFARRMETLALRRWLAASAAIAGITALIGMRVRSTLRPDDLLRSSQR